MQALDGWLKAVRTDGLVLVRTRVAGPWGYAMEPGDAVVFHSERHVVDAPSRSGDPKLWQ